MRWHVQVADARPNFLLRDTYSGEIVRVGERVFALQQTSNFRDAGGYVVAGGKHVRWGMIYRSDAQPMLTDADLREIKGLGIARLVDLRSSQERAIKPTRLGGIPFTAIGYSIDTMLDPAQMSQTPEKLEFDTDSNVRSYRAMPTQLALQLRIIFRAMLAEFLGQCSRK